jgi:hypothetical protein
MGGILLSEIVGCQADFRAFRAQTVDGKVLDAPESCGIPVSKDKPAIHHDDLMMIYSEADDKAPEAVYADSEGHHTTLSPDLSWDGQRQAGGAF